MAPGQKLNSTECVAAFATLTKHARLHAKSGLDRHIDHYADALTKLVRGCGLPNSPCAAHCTSLSVSRLTTAGRRKRRAKPKPKVDVEPEFLKRWF